ncbi:MAG TPA: AMP-binding protein [Acidimicrobiales bacterium]
MTADNPFAPWLEPQAADRPVSLRPLLARAVAERPGHPALVGASGRRSFAELDADSATVASTLYGLGVRAGDRVAVSLPNDLAVVTALLGIWRLGAVYVGVHRALGSPEKAFFLDDSGARVLLADPEVVAEVGKERADRTALEHLVSVDPGGEDEWGMLLAEHGARWPDADAHVDVDPLALAAIAYTSGTTGRPKGVMHSQHNALLPGVVFVTRGSFTADEPIAVVHPLTILNLMVLNPLTTLAATSTCVLCDRHDAVSLAARIRDEKVACISCVPTIFYDLLTDPRIDPSDLVTLTKPRTGGSAMSADLKRLFTERFGVRPATSYALTEGPTLVTRQDEGHDYPEGNLGPPLPHIEITIRDERGGLLAPGEAGEICFGPTSHGPWAGVYRTMLGYYGRPGESGESLRDGVVHSGDVGYLEPDGTLVLVDRRSQLIIRGGSNIYPAEIERVLALDPRVVDSCVVGRADPRWGEVVVAVVEVADGAEVTEAELLELCRTHVATFKTPAEIRFTDALPRGPLGKVARTEVAELVR